jgi:hypothetical protein
MAWGRNAHTHTQTHSERALLLLFSVWGGARMTHHAEDCCEEADKSMPTGLEELEEAGA